jgi:CBS domain-containing protein
MAIGLDLAAQRPADSFPYRHRVRAVMGTPPQFIAPDTHIREAAARMRALRIGSLLVQGAEQGRAAGIVTERDVLDAVAQDGPLALERPVSSIMSAPVVTVPENAMLHVAMGRMERLAIRHLAAVDQGGRIVGIVSSRALLKLRAGKELALGDAVATARDAAALKAVQAGLPELARVLRDDETSAPKIATVISATLRDTTQRAAELAEAAMAADGWGAPPARYALLVLGSGGRGESLLAADQDNAIVHTGGERDDTWFAELGKRVADQLNEAGIPYCKGGIMAANAAWRRSLASWEEQIAEWTARAEGENLLNVDIFYDFRRAHGDPELADTLRHMAIEAAAKVPLFLRLLAKEVEEAGTALGLLGRLRLEDGRVDLKRGGTMKLVAFGRLLALKCRVTATGTADRLRGGAAAARLPGDEAERLIALLSTLMGFVIDQQLVDIAAGVAPSSRIAPAGVSREARARLKAALKGLDGLPMLARDALTG